MLKRRFRFILLEIVMISVLLVALRFSWSKQSVREVKAVEKHNNISKVEIQSQQSIVLPTKQPDEKSKPVTKKYYPPPISYAEIEELEKRMKEIKALEITIGDTSAPKSDSVVQPVQPKIYHYNNYQAYYKMIYIHDILVVNYGDSTTRIKIDAVTDGTPANIENGIETPYQRVKKENAPFKLVKENIYLQQLEKGILLFKDKEWEKAEEIFAGLWKADNHDQNALFYGAMVRYERGLYAGALFLLEDLAQVEQPVFQQDADYYKALCLLKTGERESGKDLLERIANSDSFYRDKAVSLLREIH